MNRKIIVVLGLLLSAALLFWLLPNDEKEIRSNLQQLAKYCSTTKDEAALATLASVGKAAKLCSNPCSVDIASVPIKQTFTRKELSNHMLMMKRMLPQTRFHFDDIQITFPQKKKALLTATLSLRGKNKNQRFTDAYELDIIAEKSEGNWLFSTFTVVEFMER